jgi:tetratricopeptide (TPR) repeat protein
MLEKMNVWIRRALILGPAAAVHRPRSGSPPPACSRQAVSQDAARQAVAQAQKLREAAKFAPAQALLEAKLKSLRQPTQQKTLRIALADVHFYWAKSEEAQYRYHEAIRHYQAAYRIDRILRRDYAATDLNNIATAYWNLSLHQEALQFFQQALMAFREVKDRPGEANTLSNIGFVYDSLSRYQEALRYYQQALPIQRAVKDRQGEARTLSNIGLAYLHLSHYEEALRHLQQALPLRRAVKDQQGEAITLNSIGFVYDSLSGIKKRCGTTNKCCRSSARSRIDMAKLRYSTTSALFTPT